MMNSKVNKPAQKAFPISMWDRSLLSSVDTLIIGAGFTGMRCARLLRQSDPNRVIAVLERLPAGAAASSRNAGFGCFGSPSEILADLKKFGPDSCRDLIRRRIAGIEILREELKTNNLDCREFGGFEVFFPSDQHLRDAVFENLDRVNELLQGLLPAEGLYRFESVEHSGMHFLPEALFTSIEFQLNPAQVLRHYEQELQRLHIPVLRSVEVMGFRRSKGQWKVQSSLGELNCSTLIYCGNGGRLSAGMPTPVVPARGQIVVSTELDGPIPRGNYHIQEGFYYFRNYGNSLLLGGARNLNIAGECTYSLLGSRLIHKRLREVLEQHILPGRRFRIATQWSGTMGFRADGGKDVVIANPGPGFWAAYGFGGMGVALHAKVSETLVERVLGF